MREDLPPATKGACPDGLGHQLGIELGKANGHTGNDQDSVGVPCAVTPGLGLCLIAVRASEGPPCGHRGLQRHPVEIWQNSAVVRGLKKQKVGLFLFSTQGFSTKCRRFCH